MKRGNMSDLLYLAQIIKHDFDKVVTKIYPHYQESHRYKELMEMIGELQSGDLKDHSTFNYQGNNCEELESDFMCIQNTVDEFTYGFEQMRVGKYT